MTGCMLHFANFETVLRIQSFDNFLTDERCSSLSKLLSIVPTSLNFYKILLDDWFVLHFAMVQEGSQNS